MSNLRKLISNSRIFTKNSEADLVKILEVEGQPLGSEVELRTMAITPSMVLVECRFTKGQASKPHQHPDHDSIVYVVSGKVRVTIDSEIFIANPGDAWYNKPGVLHHIEALEDSISIEVKSPPIKAWA